MYKSANVSKRIKDTAVQKNIILKKMFVDVGLGFNTMANMNSGKMPSSGSLGKIADYLDCSVDYLLGRTDNPKVNK